ncbi:hypothetical protein [Psychrobacillus sp. BM2]|uniref:hypothetical protein n=1 Tax=Psychrobacillus sp. BM2 TaxID=3400421 RepID=UPI003B02E8B9
MSKYFIGYIEIERQIDFYFQMKQVEKQFELQLTMDGIISERHKFKLQHVHDVSHKPFSFGGGLLYLHTNQGVFPFQIQENPSNFIQGFKLLKTELS